MEVEMSTGVTVYVFQRHVVREERIPSSREMHAPMQGFVALLRELSVDRRNGAIELGAHSAAVVDESSRTRAVVVHRVEWRRCSVEDASVDAAYWFRQSAKYMHKKKQPLYDHVTEHHVK